jgi:uncharacterized protein (DUF433 family)
MASAARAVYSHVTKEPGVRGGKACIDDTRIAVVDIVALLRAGKVPHEMLEAYPSLSLAQIHAALSYYYENPEEIEAIFAVDDDTEVDHERRRATHLARRNAE